MQEDFHPWHLLPIEHHKETGLHIANVTCVAILILLIIGLFAAAIIPQRRAASATPTRSSHAVATPSRTPGARR